jgi:hypothetical protein
LASPCDGVDQTTPLSRSWKRELRVSKPARVTSTPWLRKRSMIEAIEATLEASQMCDRVRSMVTREGSSA